MKTHLLAAAILLTFSMLPGCTRDQATTGAPGPRPDNTAANKVDRDTATVTPPDQAENTADIRITADIRRAVVDDKSLSTNAHNAKIVTSNGTVTLRGVVDSDSEKSALETKAKSVGGVTRVDNQLEVTVKNP